MSHQPVLHVPQEQDDCPLHACSLSASPFLIQNNGFTTVGARKVYRHFKICQLYPGLHGQQHGRQVREGFCPSALLWSDPTRSPASSSGAPNTGQTWSCWSGARGGHSNDPRAGAPLLGRKAETAGAVQPGEEKTLGRPYSIIPLPEGTYKKAGEGLFTRGKGFRLAEGRFRLDKKKTFSTLRVVRPWHRLPREAVDVPFLEVFKARLDGALSNLVWWKLSLPMAGGLELDGL